MNDTHPDIMRVHVKTLQQAGPRRRAAIASRLTNESKWRTRQSIAKAHPALSEFDRSIMLIELNYGSILAANVRARLESHRK